MTWEEYAQLAVKINGTDPDDVRWGGYLPDLGSQPGGPGAGEYLHDDELPATMDF